MKSSELLKKVVGIMESSECLDPDKGICRYCYNYKEPGYSGLCTTTYSRISVRIAEKLERSLYLPSWLLENKHITTREYLSIMDFPERDLRAPEIPITPEERDAARRKLKLTRIAWARQLAEEFEAEGD